MNQTVQNRSFEILIILILKKPCRFPLIVVEMNQVIFVSLIFTIRIPTFKYNSKINFSVTR